MNNSRANSSKNSIQIYEQVTIFWTRDKPSSGAHDLQPENQYKERDPLLMSEGFVFIESAEDSS